MVKRTVIALLVLAGIAALVVLALQREGRPRKPDARSQTAALPEPDPIAAALPAIHSESPTATTTLSQTSPLLSRIEAQLARLDRGAATAEELEVLRRELLGADPQQSLAAILDFLASGRDAATEEGFTLGENGVLTGAPTLRVLLIDLLGRIAKGAGSAAATTFARRNLEAKTSPDEWAISLRNVAWHEPAATGYLAGKMREMLSYEPWRTMPSDGMLEAFDVIVFSRDPSFVPTLAGLTRDGDSPLQRAAAVALDRLGEVSPLEVMTHLNSNPGELRDRPFLRADYFAKADLNQLAQRTAVEVYLSRADVSADEKTKLLKGFTVPASFVSPTPNLLTPEALADETPERLEAFRKALQEWQAVGRFPELSAPIEQVQQRIGR